MADLSLDLTKGSQNFGDLLVIADDLVLTSDIDANGTNNILQDILTRLKFFLGEWILDNTLGLPWFQQILVKAPKLADIDAIFQNSILGTPGVTQLTTYSSKPDPAKRTLSVSFTCITTSGTVSYSGPISPVSGGQNQ